MNKIMKFSFLVITITLTATSLNLQADPCADCRKDSKKCQEHNPFHGNCFERYFQCACIANKCNEEICHRF
jgi:hypothetical protein